MAKKHILKGFGVFALFAAFTFANVISATPVHAVTEYPIYMQVSPAMRDMGELKAGSTYEGEFKVYNNGTEDFSYVVSAAPYSVTDESYSSQYTVINSYNRISNWFTFDHTEGFLKSGEFDEVHYVVNVPYDTVGGAQNAVIIVETKDPLNTNSMVQATARIGLTVYSRVDGENIKECGKIIELKAPTFLLNPPMTVSARVENCGNVDLAMKQVMNVYPLFSNEPIYTNADKPTILQTLPETRRYNEISWEASPAIGIYWIEEIVTYGGKVETLKKIVVVCPLWLIILIILFIGAAVFWVVSRNRDRKGKKEAE
jgi:hypothetical protein